MIDSGERPRRRGPRLRLGILTSHPIQYQAPWFRALAQELDLHVYFAHRQSAAQQAEAGYGVVFDWDIDLLSGYEHSFLHNVSKQPGVYSFAGCDTPEISALIGEQRFDAFLVNGWYLKSYLQALVACKRRGVPVLVRGDSQLASGRGRLKRAVKAIGYRALLRAFSACLYPGQRNREYLLHYGVPESRLFHAPHFVDNARFAARAAEARAERPALRRALGLDEHDVAALFVGRFVAFKRPSDLIEAVARLPRSRCVRPVYVGAGPLEPALRARAEALGVRALFLGFRNQLELPATYAACDLIALTSNADETWGLVVNEAMASGLPAIVSRDCGCAPDLIDEGSTGFSYPAADTGALAAKLDALIPKLGSHAVSDALAAKLEQYSCERAVAGTLEALHHVAASPAT